MRAVLYRQYALECLYFARDLRGESSKAVLLEMAQNWLALADQAEKNDRADAARQPPAQDLQVGP
jgi:hypothetical protein